MAAIPQKGRTAIRDALAALVTHVGVTEDETAFSDSQAELDPAGDVAASRLIKAATVTNVDGDTIDATVGIDGDSEFTGKLVRALGAMSGPTRSDLVTRNVRSGAIGVQAGDTFTLGVRLKVQDASA